jgi:hypothetical protein
MSHMRIACPGQDKPATIISGVSNQEFSNPRIQELEKEHRPRLPCLTMPGSLTPDRTGVRPTASSRRPATSRFLEFLSS